MALVVDGCAAQATGTAEREAMAEMIDRIGTPCEITLGANMGYDTRPSSNLCSGGGVKPYLVPNTYESAIGSAGGGRRYRAATPSVSPPVHALMFEIGADSVQFPARRDCSLTSHHRLEVTARKIRKLGRMAARDTVGETWRINLVLRR